MSDGWGPPEEKKPEPDSPTEPGKDSTSEPGKDSATEPLKDSPTEPLKDPASADATGRLSKLPGRIPLTIAASVVAVAAIAATSWGLARHGGGEQAEPNDPDAGVTFGPNAPSETPSSSFPTFTGFPTAPTTPTLSTESTLPTATVPTFTGFPTFPSAPAPTFPTRTFSYPTPTLPLPTTTTTTPTPDPDSVEVTPVAPVATPITRCGKYGSVGIVETTGVRYSLVVGNGKEGRWVVRAAARKGYKIAAGAETRFKGKLGQHHRCPSELALRNVSTAPTGEPADDPWSVSVKVDVPKKEKRDLSVTYAFDTEVELVDSAGADWACGEPEGSEVTCTYDGGPGKSSVSLTVLAVDGLGQPVPPSGSVSLSADDEAVATADFDGNAP